MYKIIGADGKEYGPISIEQMRDWMRQGRVSLQTQVRPEAGGDWRPLSTYPELNPATSLPPLPPPSFSDQASKKIPAGVCGLILGSLGIHKFILGYTTSGVIMLLVTIVGGFLTCGLSSIVMYVIGLIEGIVYLTKTDEEFIRTYVDGRKEWF